jgi:5'-nucleotidase
VVAFTNPEGIRSDLNLRGSELPCNVTYGEAFSVQPFGNNLVTMTLSGTQIDTLLEQQFDTHLLEIKVYYRSQQASAIPGTKGPPLARRSISPA